VTTGILVAGAPVGAPAATAAGVSSADVTAPAAPDIPLANVKAHLSQLPVDRHRRGSVADAAAL
jgi:hypothetical protein